MSRASSDEQRLHDVQGIPTSAKLDHTALGGSGHRKVPHVLDWRPKFMSYRFRHRIPVTHQIQTPCLAELDIGDAAMIPHANETLHPPVRRLTKQPAYDANHPVCSAPVDASGCRGA
jgi:hypothetical protein